MKSNNSNGGGIGFLSLLEIVFIVLKLLDKIDWSWWLVLAPTWIPTLVIVVAFCGWRVWKSLRVVWKQRHCILHGHNYETKVEYRQLTYGMSSRMVTRCTKCGKLKPEERGKRHGSLED